MQHWAKDQIPDVHPTLKKPLAKEHGEQSAFTDDQPKEENKKADESLDEAIKTAEEKLWRLLDLRSMLLMNVVLKPSVMSKWRKSLTNEQL